MALPGGTKRFIIEKWKNIYIQNKRESENTKEYWNPKFSLPVLCFCYFNQLCDIVGQRQEGHLSGLDGLVATINHRHNTTHNYSWTVTCYIILHWVALSHCDLATLLHHQYCSALPCNNPPSLRSQASISFFIVSLLRVSFIFQDTLIFHILGIILIGVWFSFS